MRIDRVKGLFIFVLENAKREEEVEYKNWVSMGDFFHLLLAETTPTITWKELVSGESKEKEEEITSLTMSDRERLILLLVGLKIMREITQKGTSTKADKVLKMFQNYLHQHVEDLEKDYDTKEEEKGESSQT